MKMRGKRTSNVHFRTRNGAVTVSCACRDCGDGNTATRASERREAGAEIASQLADLTVPERCEDCGQCDGWECQGDASYEPLLPVAEGEQVGPVCRACKRTLEPVFDPDSPYQFKDALWIGFHGGYGMFVDNLDVSEVWGDPSKRVLPGGPDYETVICGPCAGALLKAAPWIEEMFRTE